MTEKEHLYLLMHVPGVGAVTLHKLYEYFHSFREVWMADRKALMESGILTPARLQALLETKKAENTIRKEYDELQKRGILFYTFFEEEYPGKLTSLYDRPAGLFIRGKMPKEDVPAVAIVGARNCSEYGRDTAEWFAKVLAENGIQIISGLAVGVDGAAHKGTLQAGGDTFGVLGCGINVCYPRENYALFSEIAQKGGLLTEFVPGTKPVQMNFPMRNRIISGLSDAVIVVEAREKSGSLITADLALDQGKEVFAVPGRISDGLSAGCNRLLQTGASVCLGPEEVLEFLGLKYERKLSVHKNSEKRLAKKENLLYSCLDSRPRHLEEIVEKCQIPVKEAMEILLKLELSGLIRGNGNQYYYRKL